MFILERRLLLWRLCACSVEHIIPSKTLSNKVNLGTGRRLKLADNAKDAADEDNLDYEADFESVHRSHKQHMLEMEMFREKLQYDIVRQKYFKMKYPNFLTWYDKEQIRLLHRKDPEEWTLMKLSEGFPAVPYIIKKIIKSNWRPENSAKIRSHDEAVCENWRKFKNNEFDHLPEDMVEHLKKFSERELNIQSYEDIEVKKEIQVEQKHKYTMFSDIITSYEKLKNKNNPEISECKITTMEVINKKNNSKEKHKVNSEEDSYVSGEIKDRCPITLDSLKNELKEDFDRGRYVSPVDMSIIDLNEEKFKDHLMKQPTSSIDEIDTVKYNTGKIMVVDDKKQRDYDHLIYPEKIKIPKKVLKKGCTYKLNDCYYDSYGRFMYRVPGMT